MTARSAVVLGAVALAGVSMVLVGATVGALARGPWLAVAAAGVMVSAGALVALALMGKDNTNTYAENTQKEQNNV